MKINIENNKMTQHKPLAMNLQLFAEKSEGEQETLPGDDKKEEKSGDNFELPKTKEELVKLLQSESDKRVTGALKTAQEKWEAEYKAKLETEKAEAEKLAKMTQAEKEKHLLEKQKLEIDEREKTIAARELKLAKIDIFSEKKLPIKLVDCITGNTAEEVKANIETFETSWKAAIDEAVTERLKGKSPFYTGGNADTTGNIAKQLLELNKTDNENIQKARDSYFK